MVNENKGVRYNPRPVYDRKLLRSVIKNQFAKQHGFHKVNKNLGGNFRMIRDELKGKVK